MEKSQLMRFSKSDIPIVSLLFRMLTRIVPTLEVLTLVSNPLIS
jgi:hypothetical protein